MWCRPCGPPRVVHVDPDQRWLSEDFQAFLRANSITLLSCATESNWQLGRVEIAQRILRMMAQRTWRTSSRPAKEVIETCASHAYIESHAHEAWRRAVHCRHRPPGALPGRPERVCVPKKQSGTFVNRHGVWRGPGKIVGTESYRSPIPRVIWVVINGMMYKCSPETLDPIAEDELAFRLLARQYGRSPARRVGYHATCAWRPSRRFL